MAMETQISDLMREDTIDQNKILDNLINPENIDMKTDINDPITFAIFESIVRNLEKLLQGLDEGKIQLPITRKLLVTVLDKLKLFLVSWNRKSRSEITETLKANREEGTGAKSFFQKMAGYG